MLRVLFGERGNCRAPPVGPKPRSQRAKPRYDAAHGWPGSDLYYKHRTGASSVLSIFMQLFFRLTHGLRPRALAPRPAPPQVLGGFAHGCIAPGRATSPVCVLLARPTQHQDFFIEALPEAIFLPFEVVARLQVEPEAIRCAEVAGKP